MEKTIYRVVINDQYNGFGFANACTKFFDSIDKAIEVADETIDTKMRSVSDAMKVILTSEAEYLAALMINGLDMFSVSVWPVSMETNIVTYRDFKIRRRASCLTVSLLGTDLATCIDINDALMFADNFITSVMIQRRLMEMTADQ